MLEILTNAELEALTGYRRPAYQARWLAANGIRHWRRKDGLPVVPRAAVQGSEQPAAAQPEPRQGPNLEGLASRKTES